MSGIGHTATKRGKKVFVTCKDGSHFVDVFIESTDKRVRFRERGWVTKRVVNSLSDYKPRPEQPQSP